VPLREFQGFSAERVDRPLEREPGTAPELWRRAWRPPSGAFDLALHRFLGLQWLVSHFQVVNEPNANRVTGALARLARRVDPPSHTVLVVDDDASIRFLCRVNLELEGWAVREAETLEQAREQLADGSVDVVLLDVHVGSASGVDFLEEIRAYHPRLPVGMLTGSVGSTTLEGVEADAVISKPFRLEQLTGTVRDLAKRAERKAG
jgi:CheY-like chemotaxis protein